jgi:hypothetical protein
MFTKSKITISGNIFETYDFQEEIWHGPLPQQKLLLHGQRNRSKNGARTEVSFFRAKGRLKRLIDSNVGQWGDKKLRPRFVTFTFRENITDIKKANSEFTKFIRKFNYLLKLESSHLKYATVIEFQKRGAVHYHTLFFNLPYIRNMYDKMEKLWGNGFVISKKIDKVQNLSSYVCKYMTKEMNDKRLYGQKCYFTSMNLKKPRTIYNESVVRFVAQFMPEEIRPYERIIKSNHCGAIMYRRYDLTKHQKLKDSLLAFIK